MRAVAIGLVLWTGCIVPAPLSHDKGDTDVVAADSDTPTSPRDTFDGTWAGSDTDGGEAGDSGSSGDSGDSGDSDDTAWGGGNGGSNGGSTNGGSTGFPGSGTCGNGVREGREHCDGSDLGGQDCGTLGLGGGTLSCQPDCWFDRSGCRPGPQSYCSDTCGTLWSGDGDCDDGGFISASFSFCSFGTDCTDCGTRRTQGTFCRNTCLLDHDGECNDGGPGASGFTGDFCDLGTDCADCGPR